MGRNMGFDFIEEKIEEKIVLIKIEGGMSGTTDPREKFFYERLLELHKQEIKNIILDFTKVLYFNDCAPGFLVRICDEFENTGGGIQLIGISENALQIFQLTGLDGLFQIRESKEEALEFIKN